MADLERLVVNMHAMGDILYPVVPKNAECANPEYPEEYFFRLRSGRRSPFYVNTRDITGFSENAPLPISEQLATRKLAVTAFNELLDDFEPYHHVYGLPQAMTPLAGIIAHERDDSLLWGRVGHKEHGVGSALQGRFAVGDTVAALDNTITEGGSMLEAAKVLSDAGLRVVRLGVLVDREEDGRQKLATSTPGIQLSGVIGMRAVTAILADNRLVTSDQQRWADTYYAKLAVAPNKNP